MTEQEVIEQLSNYKRLLARKHVLDNYTIGAGITISRLNQDDQLQDLHRRLRGMPSYMYLSAREQRLENVAHAYLGRYPAGIQSQQRVVPLQGSDAEDAKLLHELKAKIGKVIAARGYDVRDDIDVVLDRVTELQDIQDEILRIDSVLAGLERYKPEYARLLRLRYVQGLTAQEAAIEIGIAERTFRSWRLNAISEFIRLAA